MTFGATREPATPLQAARTELGWKQTQAISALLRQAKRDGVALADAGSLKTMLSRWENGKRPDAVYQRLFSKIYERSAAELGFEEPRRVRRAGPPRVAPRLDSELIAYFGNVLREHLRADNMMGPHHLVDVVRAQAALLDRLLPEARGAVRSELTRLAFQYNEFAGWLCQDSGDVEAASAFTDNAMDFAMENDVDREVGYVLMRKANVAVDRGRPDRAVGLVDAALRRTRRLPPRVRALLHSQQARAYAALRDPNSTARAIEAAHVEVTRGDPDSGGLADYCNGSYVAMEAAACWHQLGRFDTAIPIFERSLADWPGAEHRRDHGLCLARLTNAYAGRGDIESACRTGATAIEVVQTATSSRALAELERLRTRLAPYRRDEEVSELDRQIHRLIAA